MASRASGDVGEIAVVGSGVAGLSVAWLLARAGRRVRLLEASDRPGGHSNTVDARLQGEEISVDTGFIVYNEQTYPNLTRLFAELSVETVGSNMSFGVSTGRVEYSGTGLDGLFAQRRNLFRPRFWSMLLDLVRFYREAGRLRPQTGTTLNELLRAGGYSRALAEDHLLPMMAAIWSTDAGSVGDMEASAFLKFFTNHGLLQFRDRPQWRTIVGGSRTYVDAMLREPGVSLETGVRVHTIERMTDGVRLVARDGVRQFDEVVLAVHAPDALRLLAVPSHAELELLEPFRYTPSTAWLHTDATLMPRQRRAWASWNYLTAADGRLCVTYWMNHLQPLTTRHDVFLTLNPPREPAQAVASFDYEHPVLNTATARAREGLWQLQGQQRTWFCGAWFGYGFHEDGLQSGLAVAEAISGVQRPWELSEPNSRISVRAQPDAASASERNAA